MYSCRGTSLVVGQVTGWLGIVTLGRGVLGIQAKGELVWANADRHRGVGFGAEFRTPVESSGTLWVAPSIGMGWFRLTAPGKLGAPHGSGPGVGLRFVGQYDVGRLALRPAVAVEVDVIGRVNFRIADAFIPPIPGDTAALHARPQHGYRSAQILLGLGIATRRNQP